MHVTAYPNTQIMKLSIKEFYSAFKEIKIKNIKFKFHIVADINNVGYNLSVQTSGNFWIKINYCGYHV